MDGDGLEETAAAERIWAANVMAAGVGWGRPCRCSGLPFPNKTWFHTSLQRLLCFSIAMVLITHDISFPAQLLKPTAPTPAAQSQRPLSGDQKEAPACPPSEGRFIFQTLSAPHTNSQPPLGS